MKQCTYTLLQRNFDVNTSVMENLYFSMFNCQSKVVSFCQKLFTDPTWEFLRNCSELELNQVEEAAVHTCTS